MNKMDLIQVLISIFVGLGFFAGIVKWAIGSYLEKSKELEQIKERENNRVIRELEKSAKDIRHEVTHLTERIKQFESTLHKVQSHISNFEKENKNISNEHRKLLDDLKAQSNLFDKFELIEIRKDLYVFKKKAI